MLDGVHEDVSAAVGNELIRAKEQFGEKYHSQHEAYGVLAEELFEVDHEMKWVSYYRDDLIRGMHLNNQDVIMSALDNMHGAAVRAACELVQVAAVCRKAMQDPEVCSDA